ncbi:MAG: TonB-dependent receptor [Candidatus Omnitrophota bacterium]|nr:TonB-dependent receptor [Candidatus Omnitrophota bacterium]
MKKKKVLMIMFLMFFGFSLSVFAAEEEEKEATLTDLIRKPLKVIFAPVRGGDFVDLIFDPAEIALSPLFDLGDMVVTPGRTMEYVYNINKNASVITSEEIEQANPQDLQQILIRESGIVINGYLGNAKDSNVGMRGFGETGLLNCVILIDGRRTNQIDLSGPDLSQIDINAVDRIEIIRGANSVLYGDNATGGVINIITKRGEKGDHIEYTQEYGSFRYWKQYFSVNGGHDLMDYFFSYSYQDSDGYRANNAYEANDIFTSITIRPDDFVDVHFSSGYHRDWYGQPGALYDGNMQQDGREGTRFPDSKAKTEDYYFTVNPRLFGGDGYHEGVLSCLMSYRSRRVNALDVGFNRYETNHHIASCEIRPKCEINSEFFDGSLENKLVFGADYFYAKDQVLSGDITFTKSQVDIIKETIGIYASDNMLINKRFIMNGGVRGEWAEYVFSQFQPAGSYDKRSPKEIALDAGLGFKYNERSQVYANYARSYRFPTTDEFFQSAYETFDWWTFAVRVFPAVLNVDLKHQTGNNYEVGIKDNSIEGLNINAAYYFIDNKNEIYYDPVSFRNENYDHTFHHGLELEARTRMFEKLTAFFNYTFQKALFEGGEYDSYMMPLVPEHKISGGFDVKPVEPLNVNFAVNYTGSRYIASDPKHNSSPLKGHVTIDLGVSVETDYIRLFGVMRNLIGEKYFSNATRNWIGNTAFYPAPERTYEWGVTIRF